MLAHCMLPARPATLLVGLQNHVGSCAHPVCDWTKTFGLVVNCLESTLEFPAASQARVYQGLPQEQ